MSWLRPVLLPLIALVAALVRWWLQGSSNLYTAPSKRFFVPDPDLKWRISDEHPVWLGLEVCGILFGVTVAVAVGAYIVKRRTGSLGRKPPILNKLLWAGAILPLAVPIVAFASGGRPAGGVDLRPADVATTIDTSRGIAGKLELPAGRYDVVPHEGSAIIARVNAGGEEFDARFAGDIQGSWQGAPSDLNQPVTAEISVATKSIDTGIDKRSEHARSGYLLGDKFPRITFTLGKVTAASNETPDAVAFRAAGSIALAGKTHAVEVTGKLVRLDAAALTRLKLTGTIMRVEADLSIAIADSAFAADKGDFDGALIPIHVSLVLRHASGN